MGVLFSMLMIEARFKSKSVRFGLEWHDKWHCDNQHIFHTIISVTVNQSRQFVSIPPTTIYSERRSVWCATEERGGGSIGRGNYGPLCSWCRLSKVLCVKPSVARIVLYSVHIARICGCCFVVVVVLSPALSVSFWTVVEQFWYTIRPRVLPFVAGCVVSWSVSQLLNWDRRILTCDSS